jgi:rhodanese-related sulfurtransferase
MSGTVHNPDHAAVLSRRAPRRFRRRLERFEEIYIHCTSGQRSKRAYDALARIGLTNLGHVSGSGMPE